MQDFRSIEFLSNHIEATMAFYHPRCIDPQGGFFHFFKDDGKIYNHQTRHLVSSTRFVFNYAMAYLEFKQSSYLPLIQHGLDFINQVHKQNQGYAWLLEDKNSQDSTNHCYGLAFILLANAMAIKAGLSHADNELCTTWDLLETYFWQPEFNLYRDEISADFATVSTYRGQNANMHMCEALLMCFEATNNLRYLERANTLAHSITQVQASQANGLIWEHYDQNWQIDWEYNRDNPKHLFRPWGFQPGHLTEWTKLLLILNRHKPQPWLVDRAQELFNSALTNAWDHQYGGICYGFGPDKTICDSDKYFWVQAESFAAAALLAIETGKAEYWQWYDKIWQYSWQHMIDHQHGAWFRILRNNNQPYSDEKSPAGKTDYHTMGACYEVIRALRLKGAQK
ncbi:AGE family epimerase/isomerase [Pseudoalteromonas tunicata]|jgi:mannose/cellobiose epimerase-like protein (N-acyl-D-glucosamine 2-epimerase family)|uniref:N-acylglucosamine 2-epimerase n=1 Tax=Pseudoalteromonas tunicata D2 TaxID=87626 RepID=A4C455_9GAMM|nr:AGE family epimerase/isomerase [Pseudoalteromonas tunicata]ATC97182.1 hypothetical protein PTUN_b0853 [Pseudoalteromonas tunicata]EAR30337.1 hypothetical protein PTD2_02171 [Pseudoalteromonas tunicata D2]MDP4984736.1 AGE family epimerase/isomerase [Pseudoalteromonas tunicata]